MTEDTADAGADITEDAADAGVAIAGADITEDTADAGVAVAGRWFFLPRVARFPDMAFWVASFAATSFSLRVFATGLFLATVIRLEGIRMKKEGRGVKTNSKPMPNFIPSTPGTSSSFRLHLQAITKNKIEPLKPSELL